MDIVIWGGISFIGGSFLFSKGFSWFKHKRLIENIPTSKVRSIAMGLVEVKGKVHPVPKMSLKSPFTSKKCVYYRYKVQEYRRQGKHSRWVTVLSGEDSVHFSLEDATGRVLVNPKGARVDVPVTYSFRSGSRKDPPKEVQHFLKSHGRSHEGFFGFNKKMRYTEHYIPPKQDLYILGNAGDNPFVEEATAVKGVEDIMIGKGEKRDLFFISTKDEKDLVKSFGWKVVGGLLGGILLIVLGLWIILSRFGVF